MRCFTQVITNQNASIEQLSSHLQTANQNVVYTSQLIKLVETSLLAKIESVEKYTQDSVSGLNQLFEHVTQKQMDVVLKLEPLISKINNSIASTSEEVCKQQQKDICMLKACIPFYPVGCYATDSCQRSERGPETDQRQAGLHLAATQPIGCQSY